MNHTFFVDDDTLVSAGGRRGEPKIEVFLWRAPSMAEIDAAEAKDQPSSDFGGQGKTEGKQP